MPEGLSREREPQLFDSLSRYCKELLRQGRNILAVSLPLASAEALANEPGVELGTAQVANGLHLDIGFLRPNGDLRTAQFELTPKADGRDFYLNVLQAPDRIASDASPIALVSSDEPDEQVREEQSKNTMKKIMAIGMEMKNARMSIKDGEKYFGWKFSTDFGRNEIMHITPSIAIEPTNEGLQFHGAQVQVTIEPKNWKPPFAH